MFIEKSLLLYFPFPESWVRQCWLQGLLSACQGLSDYLAEARSQAGISTHGRQRINKALRKPQISLAGWAPETQNSRPHPPHLKENNNNRILTAALRTILQFPLQGRVTPVCYLPVPFRNYFLQPAGDTVGGRRAGQRKSLWLHLI